MMKFDVLTFARAERTGSANSHQRLYYDFMINGISMKEILGVSMFDMISPLDHDILSPNHKQAKAVLMLMPNFRAEDNRFAFYICPECEDLGCGAITGDILLNGDTVIWTSFGYENNYEGITEHYNSPGIFQFELKPYLESITKL
ncbi:MAG: hypothetical protein EOP04_25595 [Proteobacteria bacterium]|nr:MAG: hypothetical protein EOP04_25595 [Pseudomonadota bacterium]